MDAPSRLSYCLFQVGVPIRYYTDQELIEKIKRMEARLDTLARQRHPEGFAEFVELMMKGSPNPEFEEELGRQLGRPFVTHRA